MGLDMFLHKVKREEVAYWRKANAIHNWFSQLYAKEYDKEGLDDCQELYVTKENLIDLRNDCEKVLQSAVLKYKEVPFKTYDYDKREYVTNTRMMKVIDDPSVAQELLPTQSGFFFGDTEYGESYIEDLKDTIRQIDDILMTVDFEEYQIVYHAWW